MLNVLDWLFYLGTVTLIVLAVASCSPAPLPVAVAAIESPLHNTCQSGDLLPDFPKCKFNQHQEELTFDRHQ